MNYWAGKTASTGWPCAYRLACFSGAFPSTKGLTGQEVIDEAEKET